MEGEITTLPCSENIVLDFFQKIEKQETINEKTGEKTIKYTQNPNSGGKFVVYNKGYTDKTNKLGILYYVEGVLTIADEEIIDNMTYLNTNTLEDLKELRNKYDIYYIDKEKPTELQSVSIEYEDNIQTNNGVVLSFKKKNKKDPNSDLYLYGIYNGEFKEVTNTKDTQQTTLFTGNTITFYQNSNVRYKGEKMNGVRCGSGIGYFDNGDRYIGEWKDGKMCKQGIYYFNDGNKYVGEWKDDNIHGQGTFYCKITIQHGEFKDDYLYSGPAYLKNNLQDEEITPDKKIYTLERDINNKNIRTLTFYGNVIGLNRNIVINIDENNIATLQDDKPLTEEEINKLKQFFNNISKEQLDGFDNYLSTLYYTTIINKEKYKNINILIPDKYVYKYKTDKEVEQTINLINQIPQENRNGKYIIPCGWLKGGHQVNLIVDFDNKIFEIVNTGGRVEQEVINNLQQELRNKFKEENWIAYENHIITQSTGNCVIASNIVATEKVMLEEKIKKYNKKEEQLTHYNEQLKKELEITKTQNAKGEDVDINDVVDEFVKEYNAQTKQIVKNLKKETTNLEKEQKTLIKNMFLLKQRVLEQFDVQFDKKLDLFKKYFVTVL